MSVRARGIAGSLGGAVCLVALLATPVVSATDIVEFSIAGDSRSIERGVKAASGLAQVESEARGKPNAQDLLAAARAEYLRLIGALYAEGYYSPVISVLVDGREAASIPPLEAPKKISKIQVIVDPGPIFVFSRAEVKPLAPGTELPLGFKVGETARSTEITQAIRTGLDGWRGVGHAKARLADERVVADHRVNTLDTTVTLAPGPRLRFGPLTITGQARMREERIRAIAGIPEGAIYNPEDLRKANERLRRSGVFSSVSFTEDDRVTPPDLLGLSLAVVEQKKRRFGFGIEGSTTGGIELSSFWMHRNLFGGGERLQIDGTIDNIGASDSGVDYYLGITLDRPATLTPDTTLSFSLDLARLDEATYSGDLFSVDVGFQHIFSDTLSGSVEVGYDYLRGSDSIGDFLYENLSLPMGLTWDTRDSALDATRGFYVDGELMPFYGFGDTDSGERLYLDGRAYHGFGGTPLNRRVVLAGRLQLGGVYGASILGTPRDFLFYSGGGGTVRGQPYQSLGVTTTLDNGEKLETGGSHFLGASVEVRTMVTETIGVVGFYDFGQVSALDFFDGDAETQAGAGIGVRYKTSVGPIRLDVAMPVEGDTGDGVQLYIGLGQAF